MKKLLKVLGIIGIGILLIICVVLEISLSNEIGTNDNKKTGMAISGAEIDKFNQHFTQYAGERVRGAQVNALLETIKNTNIANGEERQVSVEVRATEWGGKIKPEGNIKEEGYSKAMTGKTYQITFEINPSTGFVETAVISEASEY